MLAALIEKNFKWYQLVTYCGPETEKNNKFLFVDKIEKSKAQTLLRNQQCFDFKEQKAGFMQDFLFEAMFDAGHRSSSPRLVPKRGLSGLRPLQIFSTETGALFFFK